MHAFSKHMLLTKAKTTAFALVNPAFISSFKGIKEAKKLMQYSSAHCGVFTNHVMIPIHPAKPSSPGLRHQREGMGLLEYQTMPCLRDVAHGGWLCKITI
jgi:hypothetical protein